ncbi:hypothetical protein [Alkalilimnicola ehrlichii]|nr:hypothetical protein [Alkalilimnicola ehrlichii]
MPKHLVDGLRKQVCAWLLCLGCALPLLSAAEQDPVRQQLQTALLHAEFAADGEKAPAIHYHLHHVINCLVGPRGDAFREEVGNPCEGQGRGLVHDLRGSAGRDEVDLALTAALHGLNAEQVEAARAAGERVHRLLWAAQRALEQ